MMDWLHYTLIVTNIITGGIVLFVVAAICDIFKR